MANRLREDDNTAERACDWREVRDLKVVMDLQRRVPEYLIRLLGHKYFRWENVFQIQVSTLEKLDSSKCDVQQEWEIGMLRDRKQGTKRESNPEDTNLEVLAVGESDWPER